MDFFLGDCNFLDEILFVGRISKEEEVGEYLSVGFEIEVENSILVCCDGMCNVLEIKDEFGCDFVKNI